MGNIHFWGWQLIIVAAAITLPLGYTQGKEYAELEWPIDIAIAVIWVIFAINFFWMVAKRREKQMYVALWFYIATIVTVTVLHVVNSLSIPVDMFKSYSIFGGVQDALVQWWYGHNAVAFFLTTPVLGIMYYFLPKAANRPVFSYRLSIVHFWALVFLYIWAGPHHLLNTAMPDWAQSLGMLFSLMLWAPSWGGMLNGLLTLRGAWDRVRRDPVLKFFAAGVTFYGMATLEGPLLSIKAVSGLAHYTDWIIGHVHSGALGWNGFMAAGMFYFMVPRLYGRPLHSTSAANFHFYIGTFGILIYVASMWVAGITQGLMWRTETADGGLTYSFVETTVKLRWLYWTRLVGGLLYLSGFFLVSWNLVATIRRGKPTDGTAEVVAEDDMPRAKVVSWTRLVTSMPVGASVAVLLILVLAGLVNPAAAMAFIMVAAVIAVFAVALSGLGGGTGTWHKIIEGRGGVFTALVVAAVLAGGVAEIVPSLISGSSVKREGTVQPYTPLELEGRDVYVAEGCYTCHSQMIRPFLWETARYGEVSTPGESAFDHPFQWGSRRIGPDLARVGGRYPHSWHVEHMIDPRAITPGSIMPPYPHLVDDEVDFDKTRRKLEAMHAIGVPYEVFEIDNAESDARGQAQTIVSELEAELEGYGKKLSVKPTSKMIALIAYLQRLGRPPVPPDETSADDKGDN
jgi:cytochrome c oxidase cbb3-type subunit I/II